MITPELQQYIQEQQSQGITNDKILQELVASGWKEQDVQEALSTKSETVLVPKHKQIRPMIIVAMLVILLGTICVFVFILLKPALKPTKNNNQEIMNQTPSTLSSPTTIPEQKETEATSSAQQLTNYSNTQGGYGISYISSWVKDESGTLVSLRDPSKGEPLPDTFGASDIMVSSIPYQSQTVATGVSVSPTPTSTHNDQAMQLANQMASGSVKELTVMGKSAYESVSDIAGAKTVNIAVVGEKNIILLQFLHIDGIESLTEGQRIVLNSVHEL